MRSDSRRGLDETAAPVTDHRAHQSNRAGHSWGRSEKYHRRPRHLYALIFDDRHVYVGQTIDLEQRRRQHAKRWPEPFTMLPLAVIEGTCADAVEHEYAWRLLAERRGLTVLADVGVTIRPHLRFTEARGRLADNLRWPSQPSPFIRWLRRFTRGFAKRAKLRVDG